jgi:hypothetical protein
LSSLVPAITVSAGASISPLTGVAENFTAPFTYTVTAADATTQQWTVTITDQPNGIADMGGQDSDIAIYPNPASDRIFIKLSAPATIYIYTLTGELMREISCENGATEVSTADFSSGVYIARLQFADGSFAVRKFGKE